MECGWINVFCSIYFSGVELVASLPVTLSIATVTPPPDDPRRIAFSAVFSGSGGKFSTGVPLRAADIKAFQIWPAILLPPYPAFIFELSLFPDQTPATSDGVYPTVQASLYSFVVPVFAATGRPGRVSALPAPKT